MSQVVWKENRFLVFYCHFYYLISCHNCPALITDLPNHRSWKFHFQVDSFAAFWSPSCEAVDLKVKFPNLANGKVKDQNGTIVATDKITKMTIKDQQTIFLLNNLAHLSPNLNELAITDSGLYKINANTFNGFVNLQTLVLSNNKLMNIPAKTFKSSKKLNKLQGQTSRVDSRAQDERQTHG